MIFLEEENFDAQLYAPPPGYHAVVTTIDYEEHLAIFDGDEFLDSNSRIPIKNVRYWQY